MHSDLEFMLQLWGSFLIKEKVIQQACYSEPENLNSELSSLLR